MGLRRDRPRPYPTFNPRVPPPLLRPLKPAKFGKTPFTPAARPANPDLPLPRNPNPTTTLRPHGTTARPPSPETQTPPTEDQGRIQDSTTTLVPPPGGALWCPNCGKTLVY